MRRLILGTAGHIDHGKTALVRALTGVDTDRLKEEKERGITVDLGFAELAVPDQDVRFGVVDVPGHEGFIRNMLAGATGMDLVLLVIAADEGIMPQTREHLSIVRFLGVPRLAVALTKSDLVDAEWLELVSEEVREALGGTPYADAPILPISSTTGEGLEALLQVLARLGLEGVERDGADIVRLPIDRVFTVRGAGTVVTGTLWSGGMRVGDRLMILPGEETVRVRSLQVHGAEVPEATAGARVAAGLTGGGISRRTVFRGQTLVRGEEWSVSRMLTCHLSVLPDTGWALEQSQRVRIHIGTAEVMARTVLLEDQVLGPGEAGWVQFRLEAPVLARGMDRLVVRSYSPVTTIAGGRVAEVLPPKRSALGEGERRALEARVGPDPGLALEALLLCGGWRGVERRALPQLTGLPPAITAASVSRLEDRGRCVVLEELLFSSSIWGEGRSRILEALSSFHRENPLKSGMPLEELRQHLPPSCAPALREGVLGRLSADAALRSEKGLARLEAFSPRLSPEQARSRDTIRQALLEAGVAVPSPSEVAKGLGSSVEEVREILRLMEAEEEVVALEGDLYLHRDAMLQAGASVVQALGGATGLGPADFRTVLAVTRKHLLPLLRFFDTVGITTRVGEERSVAKELPPEWET